VLGNESRLCLEGKVIEQAVPQYFAAFFLLLIADVKRGYFYHDPGAQQLLLRGLRVI
jgi:hypothetical protein